MLKYFDHLKTSLLFCCRNVLRGQSRLHNPSSPRPGTPSPLFIRWNNSAHNRMPVGRTQAIPAGRGTPNRSSTAQRQRPFGRNLHALPSTNGLRFRFSLLRIQQQGKMAFGRRQTGALGLSLAARHGAVSWRQHDLLDLVFEDHNRLEIDH